MNEQETISKVLTGETDIAKMSHDDFVEMLKCLGRMYFSRVMNCVDGTGKSDKEWTALSFIFSRVVEAITEKPSGNSAAMREALDKLVNFLRWEYAQDYSVPRDKLADAIDIGVAELSEPVRNCDVGTAEEQKDRFRQYCNSRDTFCGNCPLYKNRHGECEFAWAQMPYEEGGAK